MRHSVFSLNKHDDNTTIGEIVYLPEGNITPEREDEIGHWLREQRWFVELADKRGLKGIDKYPNQPVLIQIATMLLKSELERDEMSKVSSPWLSLIPRDLCQVVRKGYAIGGGVEPFAVMPKIPYMGFGYIVLEDASISENTMAKEAAHVFKLFRLHNIKQLAFLHHPVTETDPGFDIRTPFPHTRYLHSLDVLAVCTILAYNCKLPPHEARVLTLAGEVHDALTPAGGDGTKLVDRELFDEDVQFPRLLKGEKWEQFRDKWCIDGDLLTKTVLGEGVLGELLNIADKTSYIARDAHQYLDKFCFPQLKERNRTAIYQIMENLVAKNPHIAAIWEAVEVIDGKVVITDADRLADLLFLRALLFKGLYYHPHCRYMEYLVGKGVTKIMYETKRLTYEELMSHGDELIEHKVDEFFGSKYLLSSFRVLEHAKVEEYADYASACSRAASFDADNNTVVITDDFVHVSNSATKSFWVKDKGVIQKFASARPKRAAEIDALMTFPHIKRLYFYNTSSLEIDKRVLRKVKKAFIDLRRPMEAKV